MAPNLDYVSIIVFVFAAGSIIIKMIRHGDSGGAMSGAGIQMSIGEVVGSGPRLMNPSLKAHRLDDAADKTVGTE